MYLEINLNKLEDNFKKITSFNKNIYAVLKSNAYGFGDLKISRFLYDLGCRYFAVSTAEEGKRIREHLGPQVSIKCMNGIYDKNIETLKNYNLEPCLINLKQYEIYINSYLNLPCWIFFDCGMNRTGMSQENLENIDFNKLNIKGIMSHLNNTKEENLDMNSVYFANYIFEKYSYPTSFLKTAGLSLSSHYKYDFIRPGNGFFFHYPNLGTQSVGKIYSTILQIQHIKKGSAVGYDKEFIASDHMKIATIDCGYSDGLNGHYIFLDNENKYKILGRISMQLTAIDISNNFDLKEGDHICIFNNLHDYSASVGGAFISNSLSFFTERIYI
jgi:alanine racemase